MNRHCCLNIYVARNGAERIRARRKEAVPDLVEINSGARSCRSSGNSFRKLSKSLFSSFLIPFHRSRFMWIGFSFWRRNVFFEGGQIICFLPLVPSGGIGFLFSRFRYELEVSKYRSFWAFSTFFLECYCYYQELDPR